MVRFKSPNPGKHDPQKRDNLVTGDKLGTARQYSDRIKRNMQQANRAAKQLQPAIERLSIAVKQTTAQLDEVITANVPQLATEPSAKQHDAKDDRNSVPKSLSSRRKKTKEQGLDL